MTIQEREKQIKKKENELKKLNEDINSKKKLAIFLLDSIIDLRNDLIEELKKQVKP